MNINDFCAICGDEIKIGRHAIQAVIQMGKVKKVHNWCFDEAIARRDGKNVV